MITTHRSHLEARCRERGYTLDEVLPCVVAQNGDGWTIDVDHPAYPRTPKPGHEPPQPVATPPHGPGTELKKLLARVGITATPDCSCNARAAEMDRQGVEWCEANTDTIVAWLREQAEARGLPFIDAVGRMFVRRAIKNARQRSDGHPPA